MGLAPLASRGANSPPWSWIDQIRRKASSSAVAVRTCPAREPHRTSNGRKRTRCARDRELRGTRIMLTTACLELDVQAHSRPDTVHVDRLAQAEAVGVHDVALERSAIGEEPTID